MGASHAYLIDRGTSVRIIVHRWQELSSSSFFHSIAHLKSYKTVYFQKSKTIAHLCHGWSHYTRVAVLCFLDWFLDQIMLSGSKLISYSESALKTELIHVCFRYFQKFSFFPENWPLTPLQASPKNDVSRKRYFVCEIRCLMLKNTSTGEIEIDWTTK